MVPGRAGQGRVGGHRAALGLVRRDAARQSDLYKDLPVYAIHGTADAQVPCSRTDLAEQEFKKLGKADFVYRRLDGVGHDVFTGQGEELDKLCDWLVKQKRAAPANWAGEEEQLVKYGRFFKWSPDGPLGKYAEEGGK